MDFWWVLDEDDVEPGPAAGGFRLAYRLERAQERDILAVLDRRDRVALEAFLALPLRELVARIDIELARTREAGVPKLDAAGWRAVLPELVGFVLDFGPVGVGWSSRLAARNPKADEAIREYRSLRFATEYERIRGKPPRRARPPAEADPGWTVDLTSLGPWRRGYATVVKGSPPEDDLLSRLLLAQDDLRDAVGLTDALAERDEARVQRACLIRWGGPGADERYARMLADPRRRGPAARPVSEYPLDPPSGTGWRLAVPGAPASAATWRVGLDPWEVDWLSAGRLTLAAMIGHELQWSRQGLTVDAADRFVARSEVGSLVEAMYLQLLKHVQRRPRDPAEEGQPYWRIPTCPVCQGPILSSRMTEAFRNRWHRGCRKTGQARVRRQAART